MSTYMDEVNNQQKISSEITVVVLASFLFNAWEVLGWGRGELASETEM